jgi:hypothetical protein
VGAWTLVLLALAIFTFSGLIAPTQSETIITAAMAMLIFLRLRVCFIIQPFFVGRSHHVGCYSARLPSVFLFRM